MTQYDEISTISGENEHVDKMVIGAHNALKYILSLKKEDSLLVITDESKKNIGKAFEASARKLGAKTQSYVLPEESRPLSEIPEDLNPLIGSSQVFVNAFSSNAKETPFRIKLVKLQQSIGARVGHAPGITEDMMAEGPMTADYEEIVGNAWHLMEAFKSASKVHITTLEGTDITLDIKDREFETDVSIRPGCIGNLPAGEIWCAPKENGAQGMILVNGPIGDIGDVREPLKIRVVNGKIESMESEDAALLSKIRELTSLDDMASIVGEFGIGLNPKARLTGNLLEDEKAGGTAHIAFGYNENMPGGTNNSKTHRDFLFHRPTLEVEYKDGNRKVIVKDGSVVL
ncbi:MAG: aminopeptidase [Thermoplasmata archaeon]|nr:MAG: aminopeptidase [Thermoplasmata archaeon]